MTYPVFATGDVLPASDMNAIGLWLVKSQTIGSAVSSVTVTSAFSSTYDNYLITVTGGTASGSGSIRISMNASTGSTYLLAGTYGNYGVNSGVTYNPAATTSWADSIPIGGGTNYSGFITLNGPFASRPTYGFVDSSNNATFYKFAMVETSSNSNTGFTFTPGSGTLTGGTIRVYGYRN